MDIEPVGLSSGNEFLVENLQTLKIPYKQRFNYEKNMSHPVQDTIDEKDKVSVGRNIVRNYLINGT